MNALLLGVLLGHENNKTAVCIFPPYMDMENRPHNFFGVRTFDVVVHSAAFYTAACSLSPDKDMACRHHTLYQSHGMFLVSSASSGSIWAPDFHEPAWEPSTLQREMEGDPLEALPPLVDWNTG